GVGYQWAGKHAIRRTLKAYPEVPLMQTENECGDGNNTWDYAHYICELFQHYIIHGVRSYVYWNMVLPPRGRSTWGWTQNSMVVVDPETKKVTYTPEFYVMKHHSHFIEPGARRLGLTGQWAGNALCFLNPDGGLVLIIANPFKEQRELSFAHAEGVITATLPARSFSTFSIRL
ncbi:MAG TPA: glycoside hydrolase family 30 protein, partial [Telluria sp.]|nr:glycoside hydrolase family 30 protein [Telluria sp.]